jgi:hypothetical protein
MLCGREYNGPVIVVSPDGGVDIEEVAEKTPDRILKVPIDIHTGEGMSYQVNGVRCHVCGLEVQCCGSGHIVFGSVIFPSRSESESGNYELLK